ncbi:CoA transferase [Mycolicibacterium sp. 050232]|uniref:CoA transferase n=1 Tax=Mycolicibacterium sp. 050232 TaxID=3113982 RepID=UPI002E27FD3D|nr:CoA transferase [Mycolicibacterium sp. 050232]MED5810845.1 CoA transferase [Mycolicibacterium sp. 050232]
MTSGVPRTDFLTGVRVVQHGSGVAGSAAAAMLASLGASVWQLSAGPTPRAGPSIATADGPVPAIDIVLDHAKSRLEPTGDLTADIVIVDGVPAPAARPGTVVVNVSPFGLDGPDSARPGGELVAQASGGLLATIEDSEGAPVPAPGHVALRAAGAVTALAALHGLDRSRRLGEAVVVDVSVQEAVLFTAALPECAHVLFRCPGRAGSGRYLAPSGVFACRDGLVRITAVENHQWQGLLTAFDRPDWATGLEERAARIEHAELINAKVTEWTSARDKAECAAALQANGVPSTPVNGPGELLTSAQLTHRGALHTTDVAGREVTVLGTPWTTTAGGASPRRRDGLSDLTVVELTHVLAGPIVGALLGAMGAEVIRLEDPDRLDIYRRTGPFADGIAGAERGAYFAVANHSKQSVLLERDSTACEVARFLDDADVLIENVGSSRLARLGVDPAALADAGVLTLRVSGFGSDGPLAGYRVYANNVQAYGGLAGATVDPMERPARLGTVLADPLSSVIGATVIAAWALGPEHGSGAVADLSMAEVVASTVAEFVTAASAPASDVASAVRRIVHRSRDERWVAVELAGDESVGAAEIEAMISAGDAGATVDRLCDAGIRAAVVRTAGDLVTDPHLSVRGFFTEIDHPDPDLGKARLVGVPWRFAGLGPLPLGPPPALGSGNSRYERNSSANVNA